jgi:hypothetical protein
MGWLMNHFVHLAIGSCVLVLTLGVVLIVALSGLDEVPSWWTQREEIHAGDASVIERAERLENTITTELTAVRDAANPRWTRSVSDEQANAWLSVRLRKTIETHMGEDAWNNSVERVYVRIVDDELTMGARVVHQTGSAIVSAKIALELDEQQDLWAIVHSVRIGTTPVPGWAIRSLGQGDLRTGRFRLGPGALELGDGRIARLIGVRTRDARLEVVMETRSESR